MSPKPTFELLFGYFIFSGISGLEAHAARHNSSPSFYLHLGHTKRGVTVTLFVQFLPVSGYLSTPEHCKTTENAKRQNGPALTPPHLYTLQPEIQLLRNYFRNIISCNWNEIFQENNTNNFSRITNEFVICDFRESNSQKIFLVTET